LSKSSAFLVSIMFHDAERLHQADMPRYQWLLKRARDRKLHALGPRVRIVKWRTFICKGTAGKPIAYATCRYQLLA
jgi:hypothetical protein